ncbi:MAG: hypothetical protein WCC84_16810 [Candidatus Cybelea sp.]
MSQKPFMWNDNNPIEYEDPAGFEGYSPLGGTLGVPPAPPPPPDPNSYHQLELTFGLGAVSLTGVSNTVVFSIGFGVGASPQSGNLQLNGFGAALFSGDVHPNSGKTPLDVVTGESEGESGGYFFGVQDFGNKNGWVGGSGLTTPGANISDTTGFSWAQIKDAWSKVNWSDLFPASNQAPSDGPRKQNQKTQ